MFEKRDKLRLPCRYCVQICLCVGQLKPGTINIMSKYNRNPKGGRVTLRHY